jgi:hypothetical protein
MKGKEKKVEKPNKIKIEMTFDRCKESIQELLDQYQNTIDGYLNKMVEMKKQGRLAESDRYKDKLKLVLARQAKMNDLMDQVEQFQYMIDEAFAKSDVYSALGSVLNETNKINVAPEVKKMLKQMNDFEEVFSKGLNKMDSIFGKVGRKINDIDSATSSAQDREIDDIVSKRLEQYDRQTTETAQAETQLFKLGD